MKRVRHLLKEVSHHVLFPLTTGVHQEQTKEVGLQPINSHQRVMGQATEETLVQIDPKCLQRVEVRAIDALHQVLHNTVHLNTEGL